ncbi:hypothetical protein AGMMS49579_21930 [Spirochaetia bacterium]|nr:hypothetical protein AGMMS49579_21930 [Spirochaetia bacterium]
MKTKWLVGVVGIALLLGMMVSCGKTGSFDPPILPLDANITVTAATNVTITSIKIGGETATDGVPVPVSAGSYEVIVKHQPYDAELTLKTTVEVESGKSVTVTAQKVNEIEYVLDVQ